MITYMEVYYDSGCPFYILPETDLFSFKVRGSELIFTPKEASEVCQKTSSNGCSDEYTLSPKTKGRERSKRASRPIKISYDLEIFNDPLMKSVKEVNPGPLSAFSRSLERNKNLIMRQKNLSNEEYDELARISLGILGVESRFCLHDRYKFKETYGVQTSLEVYKEYISNSGNVGGNSRGCTQIKSVERFLPPGEFMTGDDLVNPSMSARATMYVLADLLAELKAKSGGENFKTEIIYPGDLQGRPSNIRDYIYYLYNGEGAQLASGAATLEYSKKISDLRTFMSYFELTDGK